MKLMETKEQKIKRRLEKKASFPYQVASGESGNRAAH